MKFSIVIPFYDNKNILDLCLHTLLHTISKLNYEIIIVNDNPDRVIKSVLSKRKKCKIISNSENGGYGYSCNRGAEEAKGDHIIFMDSDIVPQEGWIDAICKTRNHVDKYGSIGSKILDLSTGKILHYGVAFHEIDVINPFQYNISNHPYVVKDRYFQAVPSGVMFIDRDIFLSMDGFNIDMYNAYTDLDLCCRLNQEGLKTWVSSDSRVFHRGTVSGNVRYAFHSDVKTLFFRKWGNKLKNDGLDILRYSCDLFKKRMRLKLEKYLLINLSNSLFYREYIDTIKDKLNIKSVQEYNLPTMDRKLPHIKLEDRLSWNTCRLNLPLIYFVDTFYTIRSNYYWFKNRANKNDIIADRNGNILHQEELINFN